MARADGAVVRSVAAPVTHLTGHGLPKRKAKRCFSQSAPIRPHPRIAKQGKNQTYRLATGRPADQGLVPPLAAPPCRLSPACRRGLRGETSLKGGRPRLLRAQDMSPAPRSLKVYLRDGEAVVVAADGVEARLLSVLAQRRLPEQHARALFVAAADAPAQLVQLRQAEALGLFDHHDRRFRHVDADFDHRCCNHQERLATERKRSIAASRAVRAHLAVNDLNAFAEARFQFLVAIEHCRQIDGFALLDQRAPPVRPLAAIRSFSDRVDDL